ncbi:uncharacterized protein N7511_011403 [Penicillium nucicola]|uniref:uncharacterized protein n=1 Tax=Penicillium nucicola TaxID=1850975 RepID=UPI002544E0EE|nr:uncharacterized protein N7511_011403 [Penicillium nucicola]KAJ5742384.1 hypothetical protein N7511_011403 [Penicillium nucicola]
MRDRLNTQHYILANFMGYEVLHPSISLTRNSALKVADVATGTGIWLQRLSAVLSPLPGDQSHYFHGFDISDKQFPVDGDSANKISFSIHDATESFPEEHLNTYDLVHVRLLVLALPEPEIRIAMENIVQLLRPGGYIQWEDADWCHAGADKEAPTIIESMNMIIEYSATAGFCMRISESIMDQGKRLGLEVLKQDDYNILERTENYSEARLWIFQLLQALLPVTFLRTRRAESESTARSLTCQTLQNVELEYTHGVLPKFQTFAIVGKRPTDSL